MSEITEAISQDQLAESLMSDSEESTESAQLTGTEGTEESQELETATGTEEQTEETADDWFPTEQEKVFPDDVLNRYAEQRYPEILKLLENDPTNGALRQLLHDKLNTDIYLRQQESREQEFEEQPEVETRKEPTQAQPQLTTQQWMQNVERVAESLVDPEVAQMFSGQFLQAFGVKEAPTPEMAKALTKTMTTFGLNLLNTVLPQMLNSPTAEGKTFFQGLMDQNFEGFSDSHQVTNFERAWQKASGDVPQLQGKSLREIGPQLKEAAAKFAGSQEDFDSMTFKGKDGKPLSPYQNAVKKYSVLAKMVAGQKLSSAEAKTFLEAGKKAARRSQVQREAGNLGSGKSNGQIASNPSDADFWKEGVDEYRRQHGRL